MHVEKETTHNSNQDMYILMNGLKYGQTDTNISMDYPAKKLGHTQADILLLYVFFSSSKYMYT